MDNPVQWDLLDRLVIMENLDLWENKVLKEVLAQLVDLVLVVHGGILVQWVLLVLLDNQGHQVN